MYQIKKVIQMGVYNVLKKAIEKNSDKTIVFDKNRTLTAERFIQLIDTIAGMLPENTNGRRN